MKTNWLTNKQELRDYAWNKVQWNQILSQILSQIWGQVGSHVWRFVR